MFAVNTYAEIEKREKELNERHIIILLFVRPSLAGADRVIAEFNYLHHNSDRYCSIYAVGYTDNWDESSYEDYQTIKGPYGADWFYSDYAFVDFKNKLEERLKWNYSGDIELILLQSNPDGSNILNFENYLVIDINYGIRKEYIDSFPRFMEALVRASKREVEAKGAVRNIQRAKYKLKGIAESAIDSCKKIPSPIRTILKDRLFFRTSKSYSQSFNKSKASGIYI